VVSGYHKGEVGTSYPCIIGINKATGKQDQYTNMARLPEADEWTPFAAEFTAKEDNAGFVLYLRSSGAGKVYFDSVQIKPKP
jgi:hypothetical protein